MVGPKSGRIFEGEVCGAQDSGKMPILSEWTVNDVTLGDSFQAGHSQTCPRLRIISEPVLT